MDIQKYTHLMNGDIIIADTAEDETVGKATEITNIYDEIIISGLHTVRRQSDAVIDARMFSVLTTAA